MGLFNCHLPPLRTGRVKAPSLPPVARYHIGGATRRTVLRCRETFYRSNPVTRTVAAPSGTPSSACLAKT